jgi:hypothetical protein
MVGRGFIPIRFVLDPFLNHSIIWPYPHLAMSPEAKASLSEEYSNSFNFTDGEIYGKIRGYQWRNKPFAERRWRSYLSKSKQKGLSQLLRRERYKGALDTLLVIRGLWSGPGFSLGNMQEVLAMRFDEVCRGRSPQGEQ